MQDIERAEELPTVVVLCAEEELRDVITYWFMSLRVRTFVTTDGYAAAGNTLN